MGKSNQTWKDRGPKPAVFHGGASTVTLPERKPTDNDIDFKSLLLDVARSIMKDPTNLAAFQRFVAGENNAPQMAGYLKLVIDSLCGKHRAHGSSASLREDMREVVSLWLEYGNGEAEGSPAATSSPRVVTGSVSPQSGPSSTHPAKHIVGSSNPNDPDQLAAKHADLYQQELVRLKAQEDYQQSRAAKLKAREIEFVEDYLIGSTRYPAGSRATFGPDEAADYIWRGVARDPRTGEQGERFTGTTVLRVDNISQDQGIGRANPRSPGASATPQPEPAGEEKRGAGRPPSGNSLKDRLLELERAAGEVARGMKNPTRQTVARKLANQREWPYSELSLKGEIKATWIRKKTSR